MDRLIAIAPEIVATLFVVIGCGYFEHRMTMKKRGRK